MGKRCSFRILSIRNVCNAGVVVWECNGILITCEATKESTKTEGLDVKATRALSTQIKRCLWIWVCESMRSRCVSLLRDLHPEHAQGIRPCVRARQACTQSGHGVPCWSHGVPWPWYTVHLTFSPISCWKDEISKQS